MGGEILLSETKSQTVCSINQVQASYSMLKQLQVFVAPGEQ